METDTEQTTDSVILSDTTRKIIDVIKILSALVKDKSTSRQEAYQARQAVNSLKMLVADKVVG